MPEHTQPNADVTTRALIERTRGGDMDALGALFRAHSSEVFRVAWHLTASRDDAEDVVQDVFVGLPEVLRSLGDGDRLGPWLRRVAARTALMHMRSERRRRQSPVEAACGVAAGPRDGIARLAMSEALAALSPEMRAVFVLKEVEGYSHTEIASMMGISVANSEVRLHRARHKLRTILGG